MSSFTACYSKPQHWVAPKKGTQTSCLWVRTPLQSWKQFMACGQGNLDGVERFPSCSTTITPCGLCRRVLFLIPESMVCPRIELPCLIQGKSARWLLFLRLFWSWQPLRSRIFGYPTEAVPNKSPNLSLLVIPACILRVISSEGFFMTSDSIAGKS